MLPVLLITLVSGLQAQDAVVVKFLFVIEKGQEETVAWLQESLREAGVDADAVVADSIVVTIDHEDADRAKVCKGFSDGGAFVVDATWAGNDEAKAAADELQVPYVRVDLSISPALDLLDKYLTLRNSSDAVIVFENSKLIDQALYHWINSPRLRMVVSDRLDKVAAQKLKNLRPIPAAYAIVASTENMAAMFDVAFQENLLQLPERWNLVFLDFSYRHFPRNPSLSGINLLKMPSIVCCRLLGVASCSCPRDFNMQRAFLKLMVVQFTSALSRMASDFKVTETVACESHSFNATITRRFMQMLKRAAGDNGNFWELRGAYRPKIEAEVNVWTGLAKAEVVARYDTSQELIVEDGVEIKPVRAFYRVGTTYAMPWSYQEADPKTEGVRWTGYCIDFIEKLAEMMDFGYELVSPQNGTFGEKDSEGQWDGLIGDLTRGETDFAVAALIMTADREEVVDFVPPYFEQAGITIVMRKPVRKTSLFKFMTVLKLEVWLSIVAALVVTAFMIWFLDKYSPYSARNNKKAYPYECRDFSLKESFWFALTSFTPQGGGEAPKSLSARTLVAAYWLFVVLMLATFTANLAAFLTVERMQTPVQSLEQLARQSRINYTVVEGSLTHEYFINMKFAEDTLYRMWKELTLNASTDDKRYRVWDYPIREQYGHILLSINDSMPVANASEGFRIVDERLDGDFAFIHDSAEIKYEISRNCNLTEVGEVFAEKPYAIAVQQGSHLQDPLSIKILELQKDRFFEHLQAKYWNNSARGQCDNDLDSEGITLESLGGVFIATLFGLALAMLTLGVEVLYYKRKNKNIRSKQAEAKLAASEKKLTKAKVQPDSVTIGSTFKPVPRRTITPKISYISVYPRNRLPHLN